MTNSERDNHIIGIREDVSAMRTLLEVNVKQTDKNTADIEELKGKPGKRWESILSAVIAAGAGVLAGIFSKKL